MSTTAWMPKVPVLTTKNWNTWKVEMKMLLIREKLWIVVSGREERPRVEEGATLSTAAKKALSDWEDKAERAVATIFPFLESSAKTLLGEELDPVELWSRLKGLYEIQGFSATFLIWKKLLEARAGLDIPAYVSGIQENAQILQLAGYTLDNELIAAVLLAGLPQEYGPFITTITQSLRMNSVDINALISQILDESARVHITEEVGNLAFSARSDAQKAREEQKVRNARLKCWYCDTAGHKAENCWRREKDEKDNKEKDSGKRAY